MAGEHVDYGARLGVLQREQVDIRSIRRFAVHG